MRNDAGESVPDERRPRFPIGTLLKALIPALAATAVVVFIFARSAKVAEKVRGDGMRTVTLSQKDSSFARIPPSAGGATGAVLYAPRGSGLHFTVQANGLKAGVRYLLELQVDDAIYTVGDYAADPRGALAIDTTLTRFEEGVCVGTNFDPPRPTTGRHRIKFWVKRDGSPVSGTIPGIAPTAPGAQLACHGNGDGDFGYVLLENKVADFTGTNPSAHDSSR